MSVAVTTGRAPPCRSSWMTTVSIVCSFVRLAGLEECPVEERDHSPLVPPWVGGKPVGVAGVSYRPERLRLARGGIELPIQLLAADGTTGVDEEHGARGDPAYELGQVRRGCVVREDRGGHRRRRPGGHRQPLSRSRFLQMLADRAHAGALGNDCPERVRLRCGLQEQLAAERETEAADAPAVHVGSPGEEGQRCLHVPLAAPTIWVTFALALAAGVEEQDSVAVADEHSGVWLRPRTAGECDHCCAVPGRHVPSGELDAV